MFKFNRTICLRFTQTCGQMRRLKSSNNDDSPIQKIGFIGLGNMGSLMSINLIKKGFDVTVYDVNKEASDKVGKFGGKVAKSAIDIAQNVNCIITMLPASAHLKSLYLEGNGLLRYLDDDKLIIDTSTIDPSMSQELSKHFKKIGAKFIDAPVSGGVKAAEMGSLTFMVGGDSKTLDVAKPILLAMGTNIFHCGPIGSGQITKTCNNLLLGISMAGVAEAMNLGVKLGLDPNILALVINSSSGRCWSSDTYNPVPGVMPNVPSSASYKAGFATQMLAKDLKIASQAASEIGLSLNMGKQTSELYQKICDNQEGGKDFSIIYNYLKNEKI